MNLKQKLTDITTYSTVLSVIGAFLVANPDQFTRMVGFSLWTISNTIWCYYFRKTNQTNPMLLFLIYLLTSVIGIISNV